MKTRRIATACALALCCAPFLLAGGSLTPPQGPPAPTPGPEPRCDIQSLPGDSTAQHIISAPGSYYLSANNIGSSGLDGVRIDTEGPVSIDGMGFSMIGPPGSSAAFEINPLPDSHVQISNVIVRGWDHAIYAARTTQARQVTVVQDLDVQDTTLTSVQYPYRLELHSSNIGSSGQDGVDAGDGSVIIVSNIGSSGQDGVRLGDDSTITDCHISNNAGVGVRSGAGMVLKGSKILQNAFGGVDTGDDALIADNIIDGAVVAGQYLGLRSNVIMMELDDPNFAPCVFSGGLHDIRDNHFDVHGSNTAMLPAVQVLGDNVTYENNILIGRPGATPPPANSRMPPHYTGFDGSAHHYQGNGHHLGVAGTEACKFDGSLHHVRNNTFQSTAPATTAIIGNADCSLFLNNTFQNFPIGGCVAISGPNNFVAPLLTPQQALTNPHPMANLVYEPTSSP